MRNYELSGVSDHELPRTISKLDERDRETTAMLLAYLAEFDKRQLFRPAGYPSMFAFCLEKQNYSEDMAYKRIKAARTAREFSAVYAAIADGRLHLSAVVMLAPHLSDENADELIAAASHKSKAQVELMLAQRFPKPDVKPMVRALPVRRSIAQPAPQHVRSDQTKVIPPAPGRVDDRHSKLAPLAPKRFAIQATVDQSTHDKLRHAQALLGHKLPSGDIARVLDLALDALVEKLEKRKFAATDKPRRLARKAAAKRTVPARVKRAVWKRDQGQCTFVGENAHRCGAHKFLEFDHADPVARGGKATVATMRLRCRAHNQYEAEQALGASFMQDKRKRARAAQRRGKVSEPEIAA